MRMFTYNQYIVMLKRSMGKVIQGVYTPFNLFRKVYLNISSLNPR